MSNRRSAEIAALIMAEPRTTSAVRRALGLQRPAANDRVKAHLEAFYDLGCIYIKSYAAPYGSPVWAWNALPFECRDATRPDYFAKTK